MRSRAFRNVAGPALIAVMVSAPACVVNFKAERGEPPVYNVVFNPTQAGDKATLLDEQPATATWFIDEPSADNAVEGSELEVSPDILRDKKNAKLTVTMVCPFCKGPVLSKRTVVYRGAKRRSTRAVFPFTPSRAAAPDASGKLQLGFQVTDESGIQLDYVTVNVRLVAPGQSPDATALSQPGLHRAPNLEKEQGARDVDVTLTIQPGSDGMLQATVAASPDLERAFHGRNRDSKGQLVWLGTGMSSNEVGEEKGHLYAELNALINARPELTQILRGDPRAAEGSGPNLLLTDDDSRAAVKLLFEYGAKWHSLLFGMGADPRLRSVVQAIEALPRTDRALRLRVETAGVYLPWQVLAPTAQNPDATGFWGLRYELSAQPIRSPRLNRFPGRMDYKEGPIVFGQYRGDPANDVVAYLAAQMLGQVKSHFKPTGVLVANSRDAFRDQLDSNRDSVKLILTFTHANSKTLLSDDGGVIQSARGAALVFARNEALPATELSKISSHTPETEYLFRAEPVVFLNGCETGTGGFFDTKDNDFPGLFIRMGARSVIVTEAPVWGHFGYHFGSSLLDAITSGAPITAALLATRREYFEKSRNPFGLLYSYYGGADASVRLP